MITRTFESSSSSATYTTHLDPATGETSCDCPGWRFQRPNQPRGCKHTRQLAAMRPSARATATVVDFPVPTPAPAAVPKPMLASAMTRGSVDDYVGNPAWQLEEKFDGHRVIVRKAGANVTAWSRPRAGKEALTRTLPPRIVDALRALPDGIYDGELVTPGGKSWDVARLDTDKRLVLFDLLEVLGQSTVAKPYHERREMLFLALAHYDGPLLSMPDAQAVSIEAVHAIWARGGEGAILKRIDAPYQPGKRSPDWLKVKKAGSAVLTITGYVAGKTGPFATVALRGDTGQETTVKTKDNATMAAIAANPESFIGRRLVIAYTELTDDGKFRHGIWDHLAAKGE